MAKLNDQQKYISDLLYISKTVTDRIYAEVDEVQRGRGRDPKDVCESLEYAIEEAFSHVTYKGGDRQ